MTTFDTRGFYYTPTGNEAVDRALGFLQKYLNQGLIEDFEEAVDYVGSTANGVYFQAFDSDVDDSWIFRVGDISRVAYTSNGKTGGRALEATNEVWLAAPTLIPFNPARYYRMRARVRCTQVPTDPAQGKVYIGFEGIAGDGTTMVNASGADTYTSQHYVATSGLDVTDYGVGEWIDVVGYWYGVNDPATNFPSSDPSSPGLVHEDVRYMRPVFILNNSNGNGVMELDYLSIEVWTSSDEIDALGTINGPTEADADNTLHNDAGGVTNIGSFNSNEIEDAVSRALTALDNVGDLTGNILIEDGTGKVSLVKGKQGGAAEDGGSVTFSPSFQDVPTVFFRPKGIGWKGEFQSLQRDDFASGTLSSAGNTKDAELTYKAADDRYVAWYVLDYDWDAASATGPWSEIQVDLLLDTGSGFAVVDTHYHSYAGDTGTTSDQTIKELHAFHYTDATPDIVAADDFRIELQAINKQTNVGLTIRIDPLYVEYVAPRELFWWMVPDQLSVSGFTLVAKLIERFVTIAETTDNFPAGTITAESGTLALGGAGLSDDADDDEYRVTFDGELNVTSESSVATENDSFPAGTISAVGSFLSVSMAARSNDDDYDTIYDISMATTADGNHPQYDDFAAGAITSTGGTKTLSVSRKPKTGGFSATVSVDTTGGGYVTVHLEADTGSGYVSKDHASYGAGNDTLEVFSFTDATVDLNDNLRIRVVGTGTFSVDPVQASYSGYWSKSVFTIAVDVDKGSGWVEDQSSAYTVEDVDGVENTTIQSAVTKVVTDAAILAGHKIRCSVKSVVRSGSGAYSESCDPTKVTYESGQAETATLQVKVAVDSKDGAAAWQEKGVLVFQVTDDDGVEDTNTLTDEMISFSDSGIVATDDIRVRVKEVTVTGEVAASDFSIDPQDIKFNTYTGSSTEYTQTPLTGDQINWVAMT